MFNFFLIILELAYYLSEIKLYKTKVNDFFYRARLSSEILAKYIKKTILGLLTETHEVLLRLIKTPNIHVFKMAPPTEDRFPQTLL